MITKTAHEDKNKNKGKVSPVITIVLQIEPTELGPKKEIFNPIHTHHPIPQLTLEVQS